MNYNDTSDEERSSPETPLQEVTCVDDIYPRFTVALISRRSRHRPGTVVPTFRGSRRPSCLNKHGDYLSDLNHYVNGCVDWLSLFCFRWPLICDMNNVNSVAAFSLLLGMRYKRRGVDADGHVANYVETEQLIHVHSHTLSFVQTRGSVPVFWSQAGYRYNPRPRLEKGQ